MLNWNEYKEDKWVPKKEKELRILSIDGGGMKGVIPSQYLTRIEKYINGSVLDHFDIITGTSTGGIIALALSTGMSSQEIFTLYSEEGNRIFAKKKLGKGVFQPVYSNDGLKKLLKEKFKDNKIKDAQTMLCIPSIENHNANPKVYKTPHNKDYIYDESMYMWEVGLATSAAPIYFSAATIGEDETKIDGGLWANNPVLVGIAEGKKLGFDLDNIKILSLGTGSFYNVSQERARKGGLRQWKTGLVDLAMQAQSKGAAHTAKYLLEDNLIRIDPELKHTIPMDSTKKADIKAMYNEANQLYEQTFSKCVLKEFFT